MKNCLYCHDNFSTSLFSSHFHQLPFVKRDQVWPKRHTHDKEEWVERVSWVHTNSGKAPRDKERENFWVYVLRGLFFLFICQSNGAIVNYYLLQQALLLGYRPGRALIFFVSSTKCHLLYRCNFFVLVISSQYVIAHNFCSVKEQMWRPALF